MQVLYTVIRLANWLDHFPHLQTEFGMLNVIVTLRGVGG